VKGEGWKTPTNFNIAATAVNTGLY